MRLCTNRTDEGHGLAAACANMPAEASTATISAFGRDGKQGGGGRAGAAAGVEQPQPVALVRQPHALRRKSQMRVITGVGADEFVVGGCAGVERGGYVAEGQTHEALPSRGRASRCRSHSSSTAVTIAHPNRKSSTGMSNGNRTPLVWRSS